MNVHFNNILVATDFSDQSLIALEQSFNLARLINLDITLLHIIHEQHSSFISSLFTKVQTDLMKKKYEEECIEKLQKIAERYSKKKGIIIHVMVDNGKVYDRIVEIAAENEMKFIVLGTNSADPDDRKKHFIGNNTMRVIREAGCPVMTVNGKDFYSGCRSIILPLDLSKQTKHKVTKAIEIARYFTATIKVMSAQLTDEESVVNHLKEQIAEVKNHIIEQNICCTAEIVSGVKGRDTLASIIVNYAKEADGDLIIIMTQQEVDWVKLFIGSTAQEILNNASIPVMSIRPVEEEI